MSLSQIEKQSAHPCLSCGACCAYFRVSFEALEALQKHLLGSWRVPLELTENNGNASLSMKGTNHKHRPSCVALKGIIGVHASCEIYENRPSPCRRFMASFENGKRQPRCDEARKRHGLKPLRPESFKREVDKEIY